MVIFHSYIKLPEGKTSDKSITFRIASFGQCCGRIAWNQGSSIYIESLLLFSLWVKLLRSHLQVVVLFQKEHVSKYVCPCALCPCKVSEKSMPQTTDSSWENDMYIMDFPTAHRLRHKKATMAQVTTLTQYHLVIEQFSMENHWVGHICP